MASGLGKCNGHSESGPVVTDQRNLNALSYIGRNQLY